MKFVIIFCAQNALASRMVKEEEKVVNFRTNEFEDEYPALILVSLKFNRINTITLTNYYLGRSYF